MPFSFSVPFSLCIDSEIVWLWIQIAQRWTIYPETTFIRNYDPLHCKFLCWLQPVAVRFSRLTVLLGLFLLFLFNRALLIQNVNIYETNAEHSSQDSSLHYRKLWKGRNDQELAQGIFFDVKSWYQNEPLDKVLFAVRSVQLRLIL